MKSSIVIAFLLIVGLIGASEASAQTVSLTVGNGSFSKGKTTRAYVVMEIPKGLHVNSYRPKSEYAIPTRVSIKAGGASTGAVTYPPGRMRKFSFSDEPISVYEGRVVFGFNVAIPKGFRGSTVRVQADVRYQACTDEVCYAPKTKTVYLTVRVRR